MDDTRHHGRRCGCRESVPVSCVEQLYAVAQVEARVAQIFDEMAAEGHRRAHRGADA